eukprot:Amastigsp_a178036_23.p2 type:complete len:143 gc:universal Amastigsp_a178036_23:342-770(+)
MHRVLELERSHGVTFVLEQSQVFAQLRAVLGMRAVLHDEMRALCGVFPAQICDAVLGDEHLDRVFGVIGVRDRGDDCRDCAAFGGRRAHKDRRRARARKVCRAADSVHDVRAEDVRRIDMTRKIGLERRVDADESEATDDLG